MASITDRGQDDLALKGLLFLPGTVDPDVVKQVRITITNRGFRLAARQFDQIVRGHPLYSPGLTVTAFAESGTMQPPGGQAGLIG